MKSIEKELGRSIDFDLSLLAPDPSKILFFDIETTGLSAHTSSLYLIGMLYVRGDQMIFRQLFAEHMGDELPVLRAFFKFSEGFDTLIHFNGDTFDIPYLEICAAQYSLTCPLGKMKSIDILKGVRRHRKLLKLDNCRQKTIEGFLGIDREDVYGGGELIPIYQAYEKDNDPAKEHLLLLHNEDDVCDMPKLLPALTYGFALEGTAGRKLFTIEENYCSRSGEFRHITLHFPFLFPKEVRYRTDENIEVFFSGETLIITLPQYLGELKYFYPNYRDYFYLPREDWAVHKKLAAYVEKPYREPATPDTCYTKMEGYFVPALKASGLPVFSESRKEAMCWHLIGEEDFFRSYLEVLLRSL